MSITLGFDYGLARIGVAVGNALTGTARALPALACPRDEQGWKPLERLVREWQPAQFVVGRPPVQDPPHPLQSALDAFVGDLDRRFQRPVLRVDESLTSRSAAATLRQARADGHKTRRNRPGDEDSLAAAEMVSQFLLDGAEC